MKAAEAKLLRFLRKSPQCIIREIELLREYRTRLVADVVTGKLDVREAAARLTDEGALAATDEEPDVEAAFEPSDEELPAE
jgi:type I restriction enzyme S subunit